MVILYTIPAAIFITSPPHCATASISSAAFYEKLKIINTVTILKTPTLRKMKGTYLIPVAGKKPIILRDIPKKPGEEEGTSYEYLGYISSMHGFLFLKRSFAYGIYVLVLENGNTAILYNYPFQSSNGKNIIVLSQGLENPMTPNIIKISKLKDGNLTEKCTIYLTETEPESIRWITSNSFVLKAHKVTTDGVPLRKYTYTKYCF